MAMMALVNHLDAVASDMLVSATVPAPMPSGHPDIESPVDGDTIDASQVTVSGTCPVIVPAIIVSVSSNNVPAGSVACAADGTFSVPISLAYGTNVLVATVVTITGQVGGSSPPVTITGPARPTPPPSTPPSSGGSSSPSAPQTSQSSGESVGGINSLAPLLHIVPSDIYVLISASGNASWRGSVQGGNAPYKVTIDWGDGNVDHKDVSNQDLQTFTHHYDTSKPYAIVVRATDASGESTMIHNAGVTLLMQQGITSDNKTAPTGIPPVFSFIQQYVWQIYIGIFGAVAFLWYMDHGWLLPWYASNTTKIRTRRH